jgi:hypothetical protein
VIDAGHRRRERRFGIGAGLLDRRAVARMRLGQELRVLDEPRRVEAEVLGARHGCLRTSRTPNLPGWRAMAPAWCSSARQRRIVRTDFSKGGRIRGEVTRLQMRLKLPAQAIEMRMGEDTHPSAVLRQVRLSQFTITKRGEPKEGTPTKKKQKKVGPQKETLRLTVTALIDAAEQTHRDFLADYIGSTFFMTFKSEAPGLPLGGTVPGTDSDAGDVLDEQPDLELKDEKKPRGKKGGRK